MQFKRDVTVSLPLVVFKVIIADQQVLLTKHKHNFSLSTTVFCRFFQITYCIYMNDYLFWKLLSGCCMSFGIETVSSSASRYSYSGESTWRCLILNKLSKTLYFDWEKFFFQAILCLIDSVEQKFICLLQKNSLRREDTMSYWMSLPIVSEGKEKIPTSFLLAVPSIFCSIIQLMVNSTFDQMNFVFFEVHWERGDILKLWMKSWNNYNNKISQLMMLLLHWVQTLTSTTL